MLPAVLNSVGEQSICFTTLLTAIFERTTAVGSYYSQHVSRTDKGDFDAQE